MKTKQPLFHGKGLFGGKNCTTLQICAVPLKYMENTGNITKTCTLTKLKQNIRAALLCDQTVPPQMWRIKKIVVLSSISKENFALQNCVLACEGRF